MTPTYTALIVLLLVGCTQPANEPAPVYSVTDDIEEVYEVYCPDGQKKEQGKCP